MAASLTLHKGNSHLPLPTGADSWRDRGLDSRVVMGILGPASPAMMRRYQHVVDELKHDAAVAMDAALRPRTPSPTPSEGSSDEPPEGEIRQLR